MGEAFDSTLAAARTGAEWAWTNLYRQFSPAVLGYFRAQRVPEPEDLTAEVFYQVVRSLGQFEGGEAAFRSWLFVIAHRKIVDDSRHRKRRPVAPAEAQTLELRGRSGDVEHEAMRHLSQVEVAVLLAELTDNQRDVMLLRILGGLSLEETAAVLNIRPGAVSALQGRAVKRLKKKLA
ncbi:MAG: sigma-70 family RNA polymerase sigma factor [Actinomycetota bacterium]